MVASSGIEILIHAYALFFLVEEILCNLFFNSNFCRCSSFWSSALTYFLFLAQILRVAVSVTDLGNSELLTVTILPSGMLYMLLQALFHSMCVIFESIWLWICMLSLYSSFPK